MVKYCTECGTQLDDSARFCTNCGTKIDFQPDNPINEYQKNLEKTGRKRAKIPHLGGINEFRQDSIVIKKTEEVIPIKDIENFSLHQSTRNLWSDVKVDFDYNGLHYRTQQAGSDKGKLQTLENKIKARDMQKFANVGNNAAESKIDKLKELKQLLDDGIVDENEFNKLKDEIING
ncbi:MAG: zinc-ribbon domain-containing protein [Methanobrevibacter millerae]|uniref:Zinc-ribbon domain-containing protein n=1 Tax=Methanobrevibacter millerae TaxID=230361 RepID=A0A8T3VIF2_9EURY|nr:zinc-ribbon domain-containing protein [Methanobrevibacter millerae]